MEKNEIIIRSKNGESNRSIAKAKRLTAERVITPSYYKYKNDDTRFERFNKWGDGWEYKWCYTTIRTILKDMVYVGDMENRKYEVQNYKTKKRVRVPQDKHIIVLNIHEDYATESIDDSTYQNLLKDYQNEQRGLNTKLQH